MKQSGNKVLHHNPHGFLKHPLYKNDLFVCRGGPVGGSDAINIW